MSAEQAPGPRPAVDRAAFRGVYAITPDDLGTVELLRRIGAAFAAAPGGWAALQYRRKQTPHARRGDEAAAIGSLCRVHGVRFIVNDDVDLALAVDADGVHLGRDDGAIDAARRRIGSRLLGASCYDRLELARAAVAAGADYVAFGSVFPSTTKPHAVRAPLSLFAEAARLLVPRVAIGGITRDNAGAVVAAGADAIAVISELFGVPDSASRARELTRIFHPAMAT